MLRWHKGVRNLVIAKTPPRTPVERPTTVYLNDTEWITVQTTPVDLEDWILGYLVGEGQIQHPNQVEGLVVDEDRGLVWVDLATKSISDPAPHAEEEPSFAPVTHGLSVWPADLLVWMQQMLAGASLYHESGGMHVGAAVRVDTGEIIIREDIGRHNAVDKVVGAALAAGWPTDQLVLLTSGRISYEMCTRLARLGVGVAVSRTAATDQAYQVATALGIELVGYARSESSLTIYTRGTRIKGRDATWK